MATQADIQARKYALAKVRAGFNATASAMNEGSAALKPYASGYQPAVIAFNGVVDALNRAGPTILAAINAANIEAPDVVPVPVTAAVFTPNIVTQDGTGGSGPRWESVVKIADGRIVSMGWIGDHVADMSNAIYAFNPATKKMETLFPWTRDANGKNLHVSTYDNHELAYDGKCLIHFGLGVFDIEARAFIRGNRPPQTRPWNTYATGHDGSGSTYNAVYCRSDDLDLFAFYGASYGGYGTGWQELVIWKRTGPADAPMQATVIDLASTGILPAISARNNGVEYKGKMYWGGGRGAGATMANSIFTSPGINYKDGYNVVLYPDGGDADMPTGMTYAQVYYARDCTPDTFAISATPGGPALVLGPDPNGRGWNIPNYRMWSIDLTTFEVELVSEEWALGVWTTYPQLMLDAQRDRFVLAAKKFCTFDPATKKWTDITPAGYVGYEAVVGAIGNDGVAYFRGIPLVGSWVTAWQWNGIAFDVPLPSPPVALPPAPGSAILKGTVYPSMAAAQEAAQPGDTLQLVDGGREYLDVTKSITVVGAGIAQGKRSSFGRITIRAYTPGIVAVLDGLETQSTNIVPGDDSYAPGIYAIAVPGSNLKLIINRCRVANWSNGIFGSYQGDPGTTVTVTDCSIVDCGTGEGTEHNIYLPALGKLTLTGHHSMLCRGGHLNKSRAYVNEYRDSNFLCLDSHASACLDFCTGGDVTVEDCVLHKGPKTDQAYNMIFYARERYGPLPTGILDRVSFKRNILINDGPVVGHRFFDEFVRKGKDGQDHDESTWLPEQQRRAGAAVAININPPIVFEGNWVCGDGSADFMRRYPNNNLVDRSKIEQFTLPNGLPSFRLKLT